MDRQKGLIKINQVKEYMLKMYVMYHSTKQENYLHLVEFSYNNGYHSSLKVSPFEEIYRRKFNTPISCDNLTDKIIIGPELLKEMSKIRWSGLNIN